MIDQHLRVEPPSEPIHTAAPHFQTLTSEVIQLFLVEQIASRLAIDIDQIDVREKFASYGLDSRAAVEMAGELEEWSGLEIEPTLVWDYPTIEAVALHLNALQNKEFSPGESRTED